MKIKDIKNIHVFDEPQSKKSILTKDSKGVFVKKEVTPEKKMIGGMNDDAYNVHKVHQNEMTNEELGISDKRIIIPSFSTTSKLFRQHFFILRELRHRIDLLKQAYEN